jgi:hypothetical protein
MKPLGVVLMLIFVLVGIGKAWESIRPEAPARMILIDEHGGQEMAQAYCRSLGTDTDACHFTQTSAYNSFEADLLTSLATRPTCHGTEVGVKQVVLGTIHPHPDISRKDYWELQVNFTAGDGPQFWEILPPPGLSNVLPLTGSHDPNGIADHVCDIVKMVGSSFVN